MIEQKASQAPMSLEDAATAMRARAGAAAPLGHRIQFDLGEDGIIFCDGTQSPPLRDNTTRDAETTITISLADLDRVIAGDLNLTLAYMTGKLKIQRSMGVALKMGQLLEA
jgi:putative sterol carrier protein